MKFSKSKFFIICAIVAVALSLIPAILAAFGQTDIIRSGLKTVAKPFEWCASRIAAATDGFISVFTDYDRLQAENADLKDALECSVDQSADIEALKRENEWLKNFLDIKTGNPDFNFADATVIAHEAGNYSTVLTLNKGTVHGIKNNMPVITSDGVLGYVSETGLDWCKVTSIVESDSRISAYTERTQAIGTLEGDPALRAEGKCLISYEPSADIKVGDKVCTGGAGNIFPSGLLIGRISSIEADSSTRRLVAIIEPSVDFSRLSELGKVMVIRAYASNAGSRSAS